MEGKYIPLAVDLDKKQMMRPRDDLCPGLNPVIFVNIIIFSGP